MKRFLRVGLIVLPAVLCMIAIFYFSSQTAALSKNTSAELIEQVLSILPIGFDKMTPAKQQDLIQSFQFIARKGAHFTIFALLGACCFLPLSFVFRYRKFSAAAAFVLAALYAVSDELHQKFVNGRSCEVRDVLIDCAGAALGILLCYAVTSHIHTRRQKKFPARSAEKD